MTKKEKEELERKQKKRNKNKNIAILVLVILLIAFIAFFLFKEGIIKFGESNTTEPNPSNSVSDNIDDTPNISDNSSDDENNNATDDEDKTSEDEPSSDTDTSKEPENKNDGSVYSASLPLTDNDALAILNSRYGKGYSINRSSQNGGNTNFAVFKDDERYATVSVNLSTGDANERIIDSGKETKFNLLKGE